MGTGWWGRSHARCCCEDENNRVFLAPSLLIDGRGAGFPRFVPFLFLFGTPIVALFFHFLMQGW